MADGLGGKGLVIFGGELPDVEAALEAAVVDAAGADALYQSALIPRLHEDMRITLDSTLRFRRQLTTA